MTPEANQQAYSSSKLFQAIDATHLIDNQHGDFSDSFALSKSTIFFATTLRSVEKLTSNEQIGFIEYYAPNEDGVHLFE